MRTQTSSYISALCGFAAILVCAGVFFAIADYRSFTPGGEFNTRTEVVLFQLFVWFGAMLFVCGTGFAITVTPLLRFVGIVRFPAVFGVIGGGAVVASGAFGRIGAFARQFGIPFPLLLVAAGAIAGAFITLLAFVSSGALTRRRTGA